MAKKLKGDTFFLSANDLKSGGVVYFSGRKWLKKIEKAKNFNEMRLRNTKILQKNLKMNV